jgi:polyferredoxin
VPIRCFSSPRWRALWCGYACPQTVYTEIFMWIEEKIEGNRSQRMKLDQAPMSGRKCIKAAKFGAWGRFRCGRLHLVGYFTPIRELVQKPLPSVSARGSSSGSSSTAVSPTCLPA